MAQPVPPHGEVKDAVCSHCGHIEMVDQNGPSRARPEASTPDRVISRSEL